MLPALTADGLLPPGRHQASLPDIRSAFVVGAPHEDWRDLIFRALEVHSALVWRLYPGAKLWVDGGFVTHKMDAPKDVDVVALVDPAAHSIVSVEDLNPLRTLINVQADLGPFRVAQQRLQPMGGLVDSFFAAANDPAVLDYWEWEWGRVRDAPEDVRKGFVEVIP